MVLRFQQGSTVERLLTVADLCKALQVSQSTVYRWVQSDFIPHLKIGGAVRFDERAVRKWLDKRTFTGKPKMHVEI
jgi:excisionase family DNA binding protein